MAEMTPPVWAALEAVAPTLVYDCRISDATSLRLVRSVEVPTLVLDSRGSGGELTGMAAVAAEALPNSTHRSLAGGWHGVPDDVLAPVLAEFFRDQAPGSETRPPAAGGVGRRGSMPPWLPDPARFR